jgi:transaldolase
MIKYESTFRQEETMSQLDQLQALTTIVADTGDVESIRKLCPTDATTNPSLIYAASQMPEYASLVENAVAYGKSTGWSDASILSHSMDQICINFGREILSIIPGRVSIEVDARLSFDTGASIEKAHQLITLFETAGIDRERILIKLASTWESIQAARELEAEGIHCNMTLMFSLAQAVACAEAGATLVSPFVGRILDWHKKNLGVEGFKPSEDPGVISVTQIYNYFKKFDHKTVVMGASFRNVDEILELAGCDLLTIAPKFLKLLSKTEGEVPRKLEPEKAQWQNIKRLPMDEKHFRWNMNEDAMATEKLAEGIRNFTVDLLKLEDQVQKLIVK